VPPGQPTLAGFIHNLNALPNVIVMTAATFVLAARFSGDPGRRAWMWGSLVAGVLVMVAFVASTATFLAAQRAGTLQISEHGLWQRISIAAGFCWLGALSVRLLRATRS
jgi:hypothetical protein